METDLFILWARTVNAVFAPVRPLLLQHGMRMNMTDYEKICSFENLYRAHQAARRGKRNTTEVIEFELNLAERLTELSERLRSHTYQPDGYYHFYVYEPKKRSIHALKYADRVVQHCICDEVLSKCLEKRLIYDNAACRIGKGTHFAMYRLTGFLQKHYREHGAKGYFLKCDIRKYFDHIDHQILKDRLCRAVNDTDVLELLYRIIDSYEVTPGKGLPLGNQSSQWFALYYLDGLDRLVKERLGIRYYSRYMDDCILVHEDKQYLKQCLHKMRAYVENELKLEFNEKTQIYPIRNGAEYLGFHFYLSETGKVIRKLKPQAKKRYKHRLKQLQQEYSEGKVQLADISRTLTSYAGHLSHGHTYYLRRNTMKSFVLQRSPKG